MELTAQTHPRTPEEWAAYVGRLSGQTLWDKALAANTPAFIEALQTDAYEPKEITRILRMFARRLVQDGQELPSRAEGAYLDYGSLISMPPEPPPTR